MLVYVVGHLRCTQTEERLSASAFINYPELDVDDVYKRKHPRMMEKASLLFDL